jgi:peptide/nickel transport system ATP-binding protein
VTARFAEPGERLLEVRDLSVSFDTADGVLQAVRGVSFGVDRGRTLGLVGESGSGKTVATQSLLGLVRGARVAGVARFDGRDLLALPEAGLRSIRGREIAFVFQSPHASLHPLYRIGWQLAEMIQAHPRSEPGPAPTARQVRARSIELLGLVGIPRPDLRIDDYPHQYSGGMLQRAMIAMAIALRPRLLIADEPTTALDVTVQAQILRLLGRLRDELGMAILLITHDLGVIGELADEIAVLYAGQVMESGPREQVLRAPAHPYTQGLLRSRPTLAAAGVRLVPIPGQPPSLLAPPPGCPFQPRCAEAVARCGAETPPLLPVSGAAAHLAACWLAGEGAAP